MPDEPRVQAHGKQVMLDGRHLADAVSEEAAKVIALCVQFCRDTNFADPAERAVVEEFLA